MSPREKIDLALHKLARLALTVLPAFSYLKASNKHSAEPFDMLFSLVKAKFLNLGP